MATKNLFKRIASTVGAGIISLAANYASAQDTPKADLAIPQRSEAKATVKTASPSKSTDPEVRAIVNGRFYTENSDAQTQMSYSGTGKLIVDFGAPSIVAYANGGSIDQKFDTTDVHGSVRAFAAGGNLYVPLNKDISGFAEATVGFKQKDYSVESTVSNAAMKLGSDAPYVSAKLGITEKKIDDDDFGVGNRHSFVLAQLTKYFGKATGDIVQNYGDDFDSTEFRAQARYMIPGTNFSLEAGATLFDEKLGTFMQQHDFGAQGGLRYHFNGDGFLEALVLYQREQSTVDGTKTTESAPGVQFGAGYRLIDGKNFTLDANGFVGTLQGDKESVYGGLGATLYLGGKK